VTTHLISAICTPLDADGELHLPGLEAHVADQWRAGIGGLLVGGTMGLMQLQTDATFRALAEHAARLSAGRGEVLVGVGDTSFARTRDRVRAVHDLGIDGVVVVTPYLWKFAQSELVDYYRAVADASRVPVYLYDLPGLTGVKLDHDTVLAAARHPNVRGIKSSAPWDDTRRLMDRAGDRLRVVPAQAHLVDALVRCGVRENLDGVFAVAPGWATAIARAAESGDWPLAARRQQRLSALLAELTRYPLFPACAAVLNARGVSGNVAPAPMRPLAEEQRAALLDGPAVRQLVGGAE
jgi:4-hydroxy-tetrahydrodipicolinate synthase